MSSREMCGTRVNRAARLCALVMRYTTCEPTNLAKLHHTSSLRHPPLPHKRQLTSINQLPRLPAGLFDYALTSHITVVHQISHDCFQGEEKPRKLAVSSFLYSISLRSPTNRHSATPATTPPRKSPSGASRQLLHYGCRNHKISEHHTPQPRPNQLNNSKKQEQAPFFHELQRGRLQLHPVPKKSSD